MKSISTIFLLFISFYLSSQTSDFDWSKSVPGNGSYYHDQPNPNFILDNSGNIYIAGNYSPANTFGSYSMPAALDDLVSCRSDNSFYQTTRIYIARLNNNGSVAWVRVPDCNRDCGISSITYDPSGFIYISGWTYESGCIYNPPNPHLYFGSPTTNYLDHDFIIKIDLAGNVIWGIKFPNVPFAGSRLDYKNGFLYFTSMFGGTMTLGTDVLSSPNPTIYVSKINAQNGNYVWSKQTNNTGAGSNSFPEDIAADNYGNTYIIGKSSGYLSMNGNSISSGSFVLKINSNGQSQWISSIPSILSKVETDLSGFVYIVGVHVSTAYTPFISKINASGNTIWTKTFSSNYTGPYLYQTLTVNSNGIYTTGSFRNSVTIGSTTLTTNNYQDIYLAKLELNGDIQWASKISGNNSNTGDREIYNIEVDNAENIYVSGNFYPDIILGSSTYNYPYNGFDNTHCFLSKFRIEPTQTCCESVVRNISSKTLSIDNSGNGFLSLGIISSPDQINKVNVQILSASRIRYSRNNSTNIITSSGPFNIAAEIQSAPAQIGPVPKLTLDPLLPHPLEATWSGYNPVSMSTQVNLPNIKIRLPAAYSSNAYSTNWDLITVCIRVIFTNKSCLSCYMDDCMTAGRSGGPPDIKQINDAEIVK